MWFGSVFLLVKCFIIKKNRELKLLQGQLSPRSLISVRKSHLECILVTAPNSCSFRILCETQLHMASSKLAPALSRLIVQAGNCREKPASPSHPFHCHPPPLINPSSSSQQMAARTACSFLWKSWVSPEAKEAFRKNYVCQWHSLCRLWTRLSMGYQWEQ